MIRAVLLVTASFPTWERIILEKRRPAFLLAVQMLPLLLLAAVTEGYCLAHFGRGRGLGAHPHIFPVGEVVVFELVQIVFWNVIVLVNAFLVKALGDTFHGRHNLTETLTAVVYALSPFFLLRAAEPILHLNPWLFWVVAMTFCIRTLYDGLPRVMQPDPPHAFGLFLMSAVMLLLTTALARAILTWYLAGEFPGLESSFTDWGAHLVPK